MDSFNKYRLALSRKMFGNVELLEKNDPNYYTKSAKYICWSTLILGCQTQTELNDFILKTLV